MYELARHKYYPDPNPNIRYVDSDWQGWEERMMRKRRAPVSERILAMADPKPLHEDYVPPRTDFAVSKEALNCSASERVLKLSKPRSKHPEAEDFNPNTFTVSRTALLAQPSPRIEELAMPIARKVRVKK
jgi:hypothetical protein